MKKICTLVFIILAVLALCSTGYGQTATTVQKHIEQANKQFIKWFNNAQVDSIVSQYHTNACLTGRGCGKEFIQNYYKTETGKYTVRELTTLNVAVNGKNATETGLWKIQFSNSTELSGKYSTEWQLINNRWVIFRETVLE
jgi:ketosteroid isomerase-like protein